MSDRELLEELLSYILDKEFNFIDKEDLHFKVLVAITEKADEIRTSMSIARSTDDRFEECCYAQKKCELNNTDQDGDPFCTVCIRCPNYRVIREERKDCNTCKYEYIKRFDLPCSECYITRDGSFPKWTSK